MSGREVVKFEDGPLGIIIDRDENGRIVVIALSSYMETSCIGQAEASGRVHIGDEIIAVNGHCIYSLMEFANAVTASRPVYVTFRCTESIDELMKENRKKDDQKKMKSTYQKSLETYKKKQEYLRLKNAREHKEQITKSRKKPRKQENPRKNSRMNDLGGKYDYFV